MLLDHARPRSGSVEETLLVGRDADWELQSQLGERRPVGEDKLRDHVEVDRVLVPVELVPAHDVVALVYGGSGCCFEHQRDVMVLVVVDERLRLEALLLVEVGEDLSITGRSRVA